jgi:uncharacterized membrane protein YfcA
VAPSTLPSYDPRVIEQFADKLYRKASSFVAGSIVVGGALGALFGAVPLTSLGSSWPMQIERNTALVAAAVSSAGATSNVPAQKQPTAPPVAAARVA